jgi:hypothetical protein
MKQCHLNNLEKGQYKIADLMHPMHIPNVKLAMTIIFLGVFLHPKKFHGYQVHIKYQQ